VILQKVDLPVDDTLKCNLIELKLNDKETLSPMDRMLKVFDHHSFYVHTHCGLIEMLSASQLSIHQPQLFSLEWQPQLYLLSQDFTDGHCC
jgi:hypothetical protein